MLELAFHRSRNHRKSRGCTYIDRWDHGFATVYNKKSELMLMRRATASVQCCTQVVLVYLQHMSAKIHS